MHNAQLDQTHFPLIIKPVDTCFFKESRNFNQNGVAVTSQFPPPIKTILGAIRHCLGNAYHQKEGTSWKDFDQNSDQTAKLKQLIGDDTTLGNLSTVGCFLSRQSDQDTLELYFSAPLNLVKKKTQDNKESYYLLTLDKASPLQTDVGTICLPALHRVQNETHTIVENAYLSAQAYSKLLLGKKEFSFSDKDLVEAKDILSKEARTGIQRDNKTRGIKEKALFFTEHVRLKPDWAFYLELTVAKTSDFSFLTPLFKEPVILPLGGEARAASIEQQNNLCAMPKMPPPYNSNGLILYLLTPMPDHRSGNSLPLPNQSFKPQADQTHLYDGEINGVSLTLFSAVVGNPIKLGGWDQKHRRPSALTSYFPAGSCFYVEAHKSQDIKEVIEKLHLKSLCQDGYDKAQGYGRIAVGLWNENND